MAIVVVHQEAESGSRHIKVIGPMQHDADVNQARLLPPGGASRVYELEQRRQYLIILSLVPPT